MEFSRFTDKKHNKFYLLLGCFFLFSFYFSLHYYQIFYKGYPLEVGSTNLSLARNLYFQGRWSVEDNNNILLSSDLISQKGVKANDIGNKLTPIFYRYIFTLFGYNANLPVLASLFLWSISAVFIFLILYKLFSFPAAIFGFILDSFLPWFWVLSTYAGFYELAIFFFIGGLFLYFSNKNEKILLLAGIFFSFAILARNAFIISVFAILLFEFYQKRFSKKFIYLLLPILIIVGSSFIFDYINQSNVYFINDKNSYRIYSHLFPDPYTFHFNQAEYLNELKNNSAGDLADFLEMFGQKISWRQKLFTYYYSFQYYVKNFFRLPIFGGPFILFLMILGGYHLYFKNKKLLQLCLLWLLTWFIFLFFLRSSNYDHFAEIRFIVVALSAFGFYQLSLLIGNHWENKNKFTKSITVILVGLLLLQTLLVTKYVFGRQYDGETTMVVAYPMIKAINAGNIDSINDVIAVGKHPTIAGVLNYYTNKNIIYFSEETINKLIKNDKLSEAFKIYGVSRFIGYGNTLSNSINEATGISEIDYAR